MLVRTEALPGHEDYPEPFRSLLGAHDPIGARASAGAGRECSPHALALLPQHREIIAARMLVAFAGLAELRPPSAGAPVLPALAESGGPAGPATHLLVAYGLGARRFEEQLFAVDAMLVLAARGQLDADRLGRDIAELTGLRRLKPQRVVAALREAARTGAYATVWAVLSAALPASWRTKRTRPRRACSRSRPTARSGPEPVERYRRSTSWRRARARHSWSNRRGGSGQR